MDMSLSKFREIVKDMSCCSTWGCKESDSAEQQNKINMDVIKVKDLKMGD